MIISTAEFKAKYNSKTEVYRFLAFDVGAYLPPYDVVTVDHLRDLARGRRTIIKSANIKHMMIPHFEGLTIKQMLFHAKATPEVALCLPAEDREIDKLPRQYIANVIFTVIG